MLPVMEFRGNELGNIQYLFHMALDKFYGTSDKIKRK
jgi:hypothetical protein